MNKHTTLLGILGLTVLETHAGILGTSKPHVRFNEEQVDAIEEALVLNDTSALTNQITEHETTITGHLATIATHTATQTAVQSALTEAFGLNGLTAVEGATIADQISQLSNQCKAYGDKKVTHSFVKSDGKDDDEIDENADFVDPNAEHNQIINKVFNR